LQPNLTQVIFLCVLILVSLWKFFRSSIIFFYGYFFRFLLFLVILNFFFVLHVRFSWVSSLLPSSCPFPSIFSYLFRFICPSPLIVFLFIFFFPISIHCFVFIFFFCCLLFCFRSCCIIDYCVRILMLQVMLLLRLQVIVPEVFEVTVCNCSEPLRTGISRPKFLQRTGLSSTVFYVHAETNQNTLLCVFG
jgi:hypothetical protein